MARNSFKVARVAVVAGQLFTGFDFSAADVEQAAANPPIFQIRFTRMIDKLGPASAAGDGIGAPAVAEGRYVRFSSKRELFDPSRSNAPAGVLDHLLVGGNVFFGEHAPAVNARPAHAQLVFRDLRVNSPVHRCTLRENTSSVLRKLSRVMCAGSPCLVERPAPAPALVDLLELGSKC